jgi:hypothetical protein
VARTEEGIAEATSIHHDDDDPDHAIDYRPVKKFPKFGASPNFLNTALNLVSAAR